MVASRYPCRWSCTTSHGRPVESANASIVWYWMKPGTEYSIRISHHLPSVFQPLNDLVAVVRRPVPETIVVAEVPAHRLQRVVQVQDVAALFALNRRHRLQVGPGRPGRDADSHRIMNHLQPSPHPANHQRVRQLSRHITETGQYAEHERSLQYHV